MRLTVLASGSGGNSMIVEAGATTLLVDAGVPATTLDRQLAKAQIAARPTAIVVTHAHGDHCRHAAELSERWQVPVHCSSSTRRSVRLGGRRAPTVFASRSRFTVGDVEVDAMPIPHDVPQVSLRFTHAGASAVLATDLGDLPEGFTEHLAGCDVVLLESNHDAKMLWDGPYPFHLKRRVAGDRGHLSNAQTGTALRSLDRRARDVVLMHLSETNNTPELAAAAAREALGDHPARLHVASQWGITVVETGPPVQGVLFG